MAANKESFLQHFSDLIDKALRRALDAITSHATELNRLAGVLAVQITVERQEQERLRGTIDDLERKLDEIENECCHLDQGSKPNGAG